MSTEWSSTQLEKTNSSEDIQKYLRQNSSSIKEVKDSYLVPTILNLIGDNTYFSSISNFNDREKVVKSAKNSSEYLLIISINKFADLIEYQFHLSKFSNGSYHQVEQSSFFIDPQNQFYYNTIKKQVQQIFNGPIGKNKPPNPQIRIDGLTVNKVNSKLFYRSDSDTIVLDGTSSIDDNTPTKFLEYKWEVSKNGAANTFINGFSFEKSQQKLLICDTGFYTFTLSVSDGVAWSKDSLASVKIQIISKPKLELHKKQSFIIQRGIIMNREKRFNKSNDSVSFYLSNFQLESALKFSYIDSYNRRQKYFLDAHPNTQRNELEIGIRNKTKKKPDISYTKLSGLSIDTSFVKNPGTIQYKLHPNIEVGEHMFTLSSEYKGIESNKEPVLISYYEKSALNFSVGLLSYDILEAGDYNKRIGVNAIKFGFRAYLTQRLSADLDVLFPNSTTYRDTSYSVHSAAVKLNYDVFPFKFHQLISGDSFAYLTLFASYNQLLITSQEDDTEAHMVGIGIKPRMQLFKHSKKIGVLYLEGDIGYSTSYFTKETSDVHYEAWSFGVGFVYGFLKY